MYTHTHTHTHTARIQAATEACIRLGLLYRLLLQTLTLGLCYLWAILSQSCETQTLTRFILVIDNGLAHRSL